MKYSTNFHYPSFNICQDVEQKWRVLNLTSVTLTSRVARSLDHLPTRPNPFLVKDDVRFMDPDIDSVLRQYIWRYQKFNAILSYQRGNLEILKSAKQLFFSNFNFPLFKVDRGHVPFRNAEYPKVCQCEV